MDRIIHIILSELNSLTIPILINMALYILTAWFISKFAKRTVFRLMWVSLGLYIIIASALVSNSILYDIDTLLGIGFIYPHIKFVFEWLVDIYESFKRTTINTYYFFLTIYFKIRKFILWFYTTYKKIRAFFFKRNNKQKNQKQEQNSYYEKQEYSNSYEQDEKSDNRERSYKKEYKEQNSSYTNNNYQDNSNQNPYGAEFEQFFSNDSYIILGVSRSNDKNVIKKAYRKLVMKYHPDVNPQSEVKKYTQICQLINEAYEKIG